MLKKLFAVLFLLSVPLLGINTNNDIPQIAKEQLYRKGIEYLSSGNYIGALELFRFLGNYKNSKILYTEAAKFFEHIPVEVFKGGEPNIRVYIGHFSDFELVCPRRVEKVSFRVPVGGIFRKITYRGKSYKKLTLTGEKGCRILLNGVSLGKLPLGVNIDLVEYRRGAIAVLNLPLEFYLKGVLPSEVYTSWPIEALKAQAVASRTFALFNIYRARKAGKPFDVGSTTAYQVFRIPQRILPQVARAVERTRGEAVVYKGSLIYAMFHSNSGGCTHSFGEITGLNLPYLSEVKEVCDIKALKWSHWTKRLKKRTVRKILSHLGIHLKPADMGIKRNPCGRGLFITILSEDGRKITLPLAVFFRLEAKIPSDWFYVIGKSESDFLLAGRGFGHGLGMSQWGAFCLSQRGWDYKRILRFYYRGTRIERIY